MLPDNTVEISQINHHPSKSEMSLFTKFVPFHKGVHTYPVGTNNIKIFQPSILRKEKKSCKMNQMKFLSN